MEAENLKVYDTNIAQEIIDLKNADLALRDELLKSGQLNDGYSEAMRELHNSNAKTLNVIIDNIGYPTIDKGTQFDWYENGNLAPNLFDNLTKVNIRRQLIGLKSLEEQINIMQT